MIKNGILETPYNLMTLSNATGNPMLDLGYQCTDSRPYFRYINGDISYYTTVNPKNLTLQVINVYEKYINAIDGINYAAMKLVGTTSATTFSSITYNNVIYNYTNEIENIRGFYINKWAAYKPISYPQIDPLSNETRFSATLNGGIDAKFPADLVNNEYDPVNWTDAQTATIQAELVKGNYYWTYTPPSEGDIFRMTDFEGYYHKAQNPFSIVSTNFSNIIKGVYYITKEQANDNILSVTFIQRKVDDYTLGVSKMPGIFKPSEDPLYGIGVIYNNKVKPYQDDKGDFLYQFKPTETEGQSVQIAIETGKKSIIGQHTICGFIQNTKDTSSTLLFPAQALQMNIKVIPSLVAVNVEVFRENKDIIVDIFLSCPKSDYWDYVGTNLIVTGFGFAKKGTNGIIPSAIYITGAEESGTNTSWDDDCGAREYYISESDDNQDITTWKWTGSYKEKESGCNPPEHNYKIQPIVYGTTTKSKFRCVFEGIKDVIINSGNLDKTCQAGCKLTVPYFYTNREAPPPGTVGEENIDLIPYLEEWEWIPKSSNN